MTDDDFTQTPPWRAALALTRRIYQVTSDFPEREQLGLTTELRQTAGGIMHDLAEAHTAETAADRRAGYRAARGKAFRLLSQLRLSHELRYLVNRAELDELVAACRNLLEAMEAG